MNQSEVDEGFEAPKAEELLPELSAPAKASARLNPSWLRLAYALEFLIALIAIINLWSEIGGAHLDLMPWYTKLVCILGLDWCCVRFTAGLVQQQKVWTRRTVCWFAGILLFSIAMGGITYYYHLHEELDDGDDDTTAAVSSNNLRDSSQHVSTRTRPSIPIRFVARSAVRAGD